ncbi:uncharacterized protein AB675_3881 [Cyphellophora attinorum]|uniref:Circumsporozoite protein n=1 Tax=Cyphellophora attinorum TaxID=1664694 RepID=A0A0N1GWU5_9EURO|nr:uncharacterized protein AB675_3881 [Phialophora attinorum]KPI34426.1 hypothetical protein AB675_3881 [Phialophora attinorum]
MDRYILLSVLFTAAAARFNQEQIPIQAIADVQGGAPGAAATIAGETISTLLGAADPCDKLAQADKIVSELGGGADAVAAAIGLVAAEQNFNNFNADFPNICADATLPATQELRGITPLVDPALDGAEIANALSAQTKAAPINAVGKSIADLLVEAGFTSFNGADAAGGATGGAAAGGAAVGDAAANATNDNVAADNNCDDEENSR